MNEFTSTLMDPLKADADTRNTFQSCFDYVIDKAIDTNQKKFISHPVVYNLVKSRWYRTFFSARRESWLKPRRWGYFLLNLWTVFDIVFFPFLFAIFFVMHLIKHVLRKRREIDMCFVLTLGKDTSEKDTSEKEFNLINGTMSHIVKKYGVRPANYCVVLHEENQLIGNIIFGKKWSSEDELLNKIKALKQPSSPSSLCEDLEAACTAFKSQNVRKEAKKVVVLFLNDSLPTVTAKTENLKRVQKKIRDMQVNIVPVGVGDYAKLSELKVIATNDGTARRFGEYESPETLGTAVIQGSTRRLGSLSIAGNRPLYKTTMTFYSKPPYVNHHRYIATI
ncbi:uncharacterized protein LOC111329139 isoform X2 [Stylophora pistillata]|uniref:uncharacterized protein LOC111329139 isoform X2 n=1 Tax=Stylophora pistillata TaxID=50429 RepID=UPI000C039741|nr:uncharacterized protein LOC111329139 isoform X2 [Stylophora pistillata]